MTDHDPLRSLWATDNEEKFKMSIAELSERSIQFNSKIKRRNVIEYIAATIVIGAFAWVAYVVPVWSVRLGAVLIILGACYVAWKLNSVASLNAGPTSAVGEPLVERHRLELVRQRDALRSVWRWYLLPFVPGVLVFVIGIAIETAAFMPLMAVIGSSLISLGFVAVVFLAVWALNAYAARKLDDEIRALDEDSVE